MSVYGLQRWFLLGFLASVVLVSSSIHAQYVELAWDQYSPSLAGEWDWPTSLAEPCDSTGGIWACGITGYASLTASHFNDTGAQDWLARISFYPDSLFGSVVGVVPLADRRAYVAGNVGYVDNSAVVCRFDPSGDTLWSRSLDTCEARSIRADEQGNVYVASLIDDETLPDADSSEYSLAKFDSTGSTVMSRGYRVPPHSDLADMVLDSEGSAILCGTHGCVKWDSAGTFQWFIPLATYSSLHGPVLDESDNLYVVTDHLSRTLWKFSPTGDTLLQVYIEGLPVSEKAPTSAGHLAVFDETAVYYSHGGTTHKFDGEGNIVWQKSQPSGVLDLDEEGNLYLLSSTNGDLLVKRMAPDGELRWSLRYDGRGQDSDVFKDIAVRSNGDVYVLAECLIPDEWFTTDWVTLKLVQTPFICGDVDGDQNGPDIADLVYLVSYMFGEGPDLPYPILGDINGDGNQSDIADLVYLVTYMFQSGPPPIPCN